MTASPVLLDFESRSRLPLSGKYARTSRQYWAHASTQALCCAWYDTHDGSAGVWTPGERWPHDGRVLAAHNWYGFDRFGADRMGWRYAGGIDTSQQARKAGLPGALDALGTRWLGIPKDDEGSRFTKSLSAIRCPRRPKGVPVADWRAWWRGLDDDGKRHYGVQPKLDAEGFARVIDYCVSDVVIMAEAWPRLAEWLEVDADVEAVDVVVNDRGIAFDSDLARALLAHDERVADTACARAAAELGVGWTPERVRAAANSDQQFTRETGAPNAQALTVEAVDHPLARARQALASITAGKLRAGLRLVNDDGRLRDTLRYYGGHTGRWSGKGMQLQNLPRPAKHLEDINTEALADALLTGELDDADVDGDVVSLLIRSTLTAGPGQALVCADFNQIEGRATAWIAGDDLAVAVYTSGADPYKVAASAIYSVPAADVTKPQRQIGKCAELSCSYQGGPGAFEKIARGNRVDLSGLSGAERRRIVDAWRDLHAPIVRFWYAAEAAFRRAAEGRAAWVKCFQFVPADNGRDVAAFLPSGRPIVYNDVHVTPQEGRRPSLSYQGTKFREHVYGGKLVENLIQAYCRDLMADALVRAEAAGLRPVLTAHDEIVCEVPREGCADAYGELLQVMTTLPAWAAGFPIGADGWYGRRYRK